MHYRRYTVGRQFNYLEFAGLMWSLEHLAQETATFRNHSMQDLNQLFCGHGDSNARTQQSGGSQTLGLSRSSEIFKLIVATVCGIQSKSLDLSAKCA